MSDQISAAPTDGVATTLEVVGWLGAVMSVFGGILLFAEESSGSYYDDPADPTLAVVLGAAGLLLSLLIIGMARVVNYTRTTSIASKRMVQLLEIAVDRE